MPKEYAHWWLAGEVLGRLGIDGRLAAVLKRHRAFFHLGAVGPDYLFYYLRGPALEDFKKASLVLHGGEGNDTLAVLARRAETWTGGVPEKEAAFLFGFACHVAADSVFHPLVLHYVGKGSPKNEYDHHVFESVLDLYVKERLRPTSVPVTLAELTRAIAPDREAFLELLGFVSFDGGTYDRKALAACLRRYELIQALFWTARGRLAARLAGGLFPGLRNFEPSFYQRRFYRYAAAFDAELSWRHPVTGTEARTTVRALRDETADLASRYAAVFERLLDPGAAATGAEAAEILRRLRGPNLETGLFGGTAAPEEIRYISASGAAGLFGEDYTPFRLRGRSIMKTRFIWKA